jgi:hypothetical protein
MLPATIHQTFFRYLFRIKRMRSHISAATNIFSDTRSSDYLFIADVMKKKQFTRPHEDGLEKKILVKVVAAP